MAARRARWKNVARRNHPFAPRKNFHLRRRLSVFVAPFSAARLVARQRAFIPTATCASSSCRRRKWWRTSRPDISTAFAWANRGIPWPCSRAPAGVVAASAELGPGHPEKVLMVRRDFAEKRDEEHVALVAALLEACEFCDAAGKPRTDHRHARAARLCRMFRQPRCGAGSAASLISATA